MDSETTPFDLTASEDNMEPLSLSWVDASEPASQPAATVPCSRDGQGCLLHLHPLSLNLHTVM